MNLKPDDYKWIVYWLIVAWLLAASGVLVLLLRRYTFRGDQSTNPFLKETLAMPRGVFRSLLTSTVLFAVVLLEVSNLFSANAKDKFDTGSMMTAFQMVLAFYFGAKVFHHVTSADRDKTEKAAEAMIAEAGAVEAFAEPGAKG